MIEYAKRIARSTRTTGDNIPEFIKKWVTWGAGPRASMFMILAAKARALLHGEAHVSWEHIRAVAKPILRHRIILNFAAQAEGMTTDQIVDQVLEHVPEK
jgi:MoxR-like ATPase